MIIAVDMDDTLVMYTQAYRKALELNPGIQFPQSQYGFFASLRPVPGGLYYLHKLLACYDVNIQIVTRPSTKNLMSYTEKAAWVKTYLGEDFLSRLNFVNDKTLFKGDFLIDDNEWLGFEGEWIPFNCKGDKETTEWKRVYQYLAPKLTLKKDFSKQWISTL